MFARGEKSQKSCNQPQLPWRMHFNFRPTVQLKHDAFRTTRRDRGPLFHHRLQKRNRFHLSCGLLCVGSVSPPSANPGTERHGYNAHYFRKPLAAQSAAFKFIQQRFPPFGRCLHAPSRVYLQDSLLRFEMCHARHYLSFLLCLAMGAWRDAYVSPLHSVRRPPQKHPRHDYFAYRASVVRRD